MLPSLAFVPEEDFYCFNILMADFPESALNVARYFEETYIGKRLLDKSSRVPQFPVRIWKMYERVRGELARTNNTVEGWHNAFPSSITCSHPTLCILFNVLQREQSLQEATLVKWEAGVRKVQSKNSMERNARIHAIVSDYANRKFTNYLKGIAFQMLCNNSMMSLLSLFLIICHIYFNKYFMIKYKLKKNSDNSYIYQRLLCYCYFLKVGTKFLETLEIHKWILIKSYASMVLSFDKNA